MIYSYSYLIATREMQLGVIYSTSLCIISRTNVFVGYGPAWFANECHGGYSQQRHINTTLFRQFSGSTNFKNLSYLSVLRNTISRLLKRAIRHNFLSMRCLESLAPV